MQLNYTIATGEYICLMRLQFLELLKSSILDTIENHDQMGVQKVLLQKRKRTLFQGPAA